MQRGHLAFGCGGAEVPVAVLALALPLVLAAPDFADDDEAMASFHELDEESPANEGVALLHLGGTYRRIYRHPAVRLEAGALRRPLVGARWRLDLLGGLLGPHVGRTGNRLVPRCATARTSAWTRCTSVSPRAIVGLSFKRATDGKNINGGGVALGLVAGVMVARTRASALCVELWINADLYPPRCGARACEPRTGSETRENAVC